MSLIVTLLVVTLVAQCWGEPQRRNWTPQAILYLKGARKTRQKKFKTVESGFEPFCQLHADVLQKDTVQCCGAPAERKGTLYIEGLTTRAVMDLNCRCLPFFWSSCSELLKEVEAIQIIPRMNQS